MADLVSYGFLAPPAVLILLCLAGALLALSRPVLGILLSLVASICLYAAATPALSSYLLHRAEEGLPANPDLSAAQAIVVLGGDMHLGNGAGDPDTLGPITLQRVFFAARAYRQLKLPVAVSGGLVRRSQATLGSLMKAALESDLAVPVRWNEDRSRTTFANAQETARLLRAQNITNVVLVTQAWHMKRSLWVFERVGMRPLPWPAPATALHLARVDDYLPSTGALNDSFHALHELIGLIYYRQRY